MSRRLTTEEFIIRSKEIHGDKYDYSKSVYVNNRSKVVILCKIHGIFVQKAGNHMSGQGCKSCSISSPNNPNNIRKINAQRKLDCSQISIDSSRAIELSNGGFAVIDNKYYSKIKDYTWRRSATGYAVTNVKNKSIFLHKLIFSIYDSTYIGQIDHINMDKLDCRIDNLRKCSHRDNQLNRPMQSNNKSGYKGVVKIPNNRWKVQIKYGDEKVTKNFKCAIEAAKFYDLMAIKMHGKFARVNFPELMEEYLKL